MISNESTMSDDISGRVQRTHTVEVVDGRVYVTLSTEVSGCECVMVVF